MTAVHQNGNEIYMGCYGGSVIKGVIGDRAELKIDG